MRGSIVKKGKTYSCIVDLGKIDGKRKQKWFNGFRTKKEAEDKLSEVLEQLRKNSYIEPSKMVLEEYLNEWLEEYAKPKIEITTYNGYSVNIKKHINRYIGHIPLQELQPIHIQELYNTLAKNGNCRSKGGLSSRSIQYVHMVLRQALEHAYRMQMVPRNVADMVIVPKQKKYIGKFLEEEELEETLSVFKGTNIYIPVLLALVVGLRRGEALGLKWNNVNLEKKTIKIIEILVPIRKGCIFKKPKTESSIREVLISDFVVNELKSLKERQKEDKKLFGEKYIDMNLVCCYPDGKNFSPGNVSHLFAKILKRNELRHIRFHDLRHTNASLMGKAAVPLKVASARLGHAKTETTQNIYTHVMKGMQEEAAEKLNEFF